MNDTNRTVRFKLREYALQYAITHPDAPTTASALAVRLGIVRRTIRRYWDNEPITSPSLGVLNRVCRYYGCSLGDIADFDVDPAEQPIQSPAE